MIDGKLLYPIGSIYMSIQDTNPSVFFGGVWERIAKGKTLVGVDEKDSDFANSELTGGEKEHTLTISEMPKHTHPLSNTLIRGGGSYGDLYSAQGGWWESDNKTTQATSVGGDKPHNNLQPYFTCYIFARIA